MKQYSIAILAGFIGGIVLSEYYVSYAVLNITLVLLTSFTILFALDKRLDTKFFRGTGIFLLFLSIGVLRTSYSYQELPKPIFDDSVGKKVELSGEIVSRVDNKGGYKTFTINPEIHGVEIKNKPIIQVTTDRFANVSYGDVVTVTGKLESAVMNSKTNELARESRIRRGILYQVNFAEVSFVTNGEPNFLKKYSEYMRLKCIDFINKSIDKPSSDFVSGILIGEKHALSKEWYDRFTEVGMTHVIVLSGYNLAVLFAWTRIMFRRTPFAIQNVLGAVSVIMLVLISGAEPPAIRAGILVIIVALASIFQRQKDTGHFLALTTLLMLMYNPFYLLYDISFQLSIVATYGLVYIGPMVALHVKRFPAFLKEATRDTLSAQVAVLPLQLFYFGTISSVSLISNILLLPLIPIVVMLGFLTIIASPVYFLSAFVGEATTLTAAFVLRCVYVLSEMATSYTFVISIPTAICLYIILTIFVVRYKKE